MPLELSARGILFSVLGRLCFSVAMDRQIDVRIQAAKVALERAGTSCARKGISRTQAGALKELLSPLVIGRLSQERRAVLTDRLLEVAWCEDDLEQLLAILAADTSPAGLLADTSPAGSKAKRRPFQHFEPNLLYYFSAEDWKILNDRETNSAAKLECIILRIVRLGGRCLSEFTHTFATSLWLITSLGVEQSLRKPPHEKQQSLQHMKDAFRKRVRSMPSPLHYTLSLPPNPDDLKQFQPELYHEAFSSGAPVTPTVPLDTIIAVDATCKPRGGCARGGSSLGALACGSGISNVGCGSGSIAEMNVGAMMMQAFAKMMMGNVAEQPLQLSFPQRTPPRSMAALAELGTPSFAQRRAFTLETLGDAPSSDKLGDVSSARETALAIPPRATRAYQADAVGNARGADIKEVSPAVREDSESEIGEVSPIGDLEDLEGAADAETILKDTLTMFNERKEEQRKKKAEQKKKRKTEETEPSAKKLKKTAKSKKKAAKAESPGTKLKTQTKKATEAESAGEKVKTPKVHLPVEEVKTPKSHKKAQKHSIVAETPAVHKKEKAPSLQRYREPHFNIEWSRSQVMCRTGYRGPGQSHRIPIKKSESAASVSAAVEVAKAWVAKQRVAQGLD